MYNIISTKTLHVVSARSSLLLSSVYYKDTRPVSISSPNYWDKWDDRILSEDRDPSLHVGINRVADHVARFQTVVGTRSRQSTKKIILQLAQNQSDRRSKGCWVISSTKTFCAVQIVCKAMPAITRDIGMKSWHFRQGKSLTYSVITYEESLKKRTTNHREPLPGIPIEVFIHPGVNLST